MTKTIALATGSLLIIAGLVGFEVQSLFGLHLGRPYNMFYLIAGLTAWYFGSLMLPAARSFCKTFGIAWLLLAALVFMLGAAAQLRLFSWHSPPGTADAFACVVTGTLFLIAGYHRSRVVPWHQKYTLENLTQPRKLRKRETQFKFIN